MQEETFFPGQVIPCWLFNILVKIVSYSKYNSVYTKTYFTHTPEIAFPAIFHRHWNGVFLTMLMYTEKSGFYCPRIHSANSLSSQLLLMYILKDTSEKILLLVWTPTLQTWLSSFRSTTLLNKFLHPQLPESLSCNPISFPRVHFPYFSLSIQPLSEESCRTTRRLLSCL